MNTVMKNVRFWGECALSCLGLSAAVALVMIVLFGLGSTEFETGSAEVFLTILSLYPFYLVIISVFMMVMVGISHYQIYFPLLVSMNATRKEVLGGILFCQVCQIVLVLAFSMLIWFLVPGDVAQSGWTLLPLLGGGMLLFAALAMLLGAVTIRWGKIAMVITVVICAMCGGIIGFTFSILGQKGAVLPQFISAEQAGSIRWYVVAAGVILYILAGIFARILTQKIEVRI